MTQAAAGAPAGAMAPVVAFDNGATVAVGVCAFGAGGGGSFADRVQVPIKLAWAITVHKSQGMTLSRLEVVLHDAFDYGQVYVALSRAVSSAGLRVVGLDPTKIKAHPKVKAFFRRLEHAADGGV